MTTTTTTTTTNSTNSKKTGKGGPVKASRALTAKDMIEKYGYEAMLKKNGWEYAETAIRRNHAEKIATRILGALVEMPAAKQAKKAEAKAAKPAPAKGGKAVIHGIAYQPPGVVEPPATWLNHFIEYQDGKNDARGLVLDESGKPGSRILTVLRVDGEVPAVKEVNVLALGAHISDAAKVAF